MSVVVPYVGQNLFQPEDPASVMRKRRATRPAAQQTSHELPDEADGGPFISFLFGSHGIEKLTGK